MIYSSWKTHKITLFIWIIMLIMYSKIAYLKFDQTFLWENCVTQVLTTRTVTLHVLTILYIKKGLKCHYANFRLESAIFEKIRRFFFLLKTWQNWDRPFSQGANDKLLGAGKQFLSCMTSSCFEAEVLQLRSFSDFQLYVAALGATRHGCPSTTQLDSFFARKL